MSPHVSPTAHPWITFTLASMAQLMIILDATIINVALPSIQHALRFSAEDLQWVVNVYVLLFGGFILLGGRAGDILGRRPLFVGGMVLFSLASLAGGLAPSSGWLIAARAAQGLGAAIISPVAFAIVTSTFAEGPERNRAVGIYGALSGVGAALGVLLGGILTTNFGWQWVLFVNVPVGVAVIALSPFFIPATRGTGTGGSFDVLGTVSVTGALCALVYGVVKAPDNGWGSGATIGFFAASAALFAVFIATELRARHPLVRLGIFRDRTLAMANVLAFMAGMMLFGMFYFLSLYLQIVLGFSALKTGFAYLPLTLTLIISAGIASGLVTRFRFKPILTVGFVLATAGLLVLTRIVVQGTYTATILPGIELIALGLAFVFVPLSIASMQGVEPGEIGLASGLINATQQIGGAIGLAVLSTVATTHTNGLLHSLHGPTAYLRALVGGFQYAFGTAAAIAAAGIMLAVALLPGRRTGAGRTSRTADPGAAGGRELAPMAAVLEEAAG